MTDIIVVMTVWCQRLGAVFYCPHGCADIWIMKKIL